MAAEFYSCRNHGKRAWRPLAVLFVLAVLAVPGGQQQQQGRGHKRDADCANCVDDSGFGNSLGSSSLNRWTMPLLKLGEKRYYLGIFFKANWYRAAQYCRYHGMHLASIESQEESDKLEKHIKDYGLGLEHFWTSGTDQGEEGVFFWLSNGRPVTYTNWNAGEPNNFRYENGEEEHCLELWNRDGKGLKWNDTPCSFETFFVCEVQ
ncbi:C-type lectin 37Db isoform X1 [Hetaerina americana]|uniref:C-type lectin 37Db isoform X1 n=1 Tax=Hetaerina americana TaxID=62018 RepID=UPI003A7F21C2